MTFIIGLEMVLISKHTKAQKSRIVSGVAGRNIVAVYVCLARLALLLLLVEECM